MSRLDECRLIETLVGQICLNKYRGVLCTARTGQCAAHGNECTAHSQPLSNAIFLVIISRECSRPSYLHPLHNYDRTCCISDNGSDKIARISRKDKLRIFFRRFNDKHFIARRLTNSEMIWVVYCLDLYFVFWYFSGHSRVELLGLTCNCKASNHTRTVQG